MYVYHMAYKNRENVLQIHATRIKGTVFRKITNFAFCRGKTKSLMEILKRKRLQIDLCGKPLKTILDNSNNTS